MIGNMFDWIGLCLTYDTDFFTPIILKNDILIINKYLTDVLGVKLVKQTNCYNFDYPRIENLLPFSRMVEFLQDCNPVRIQFV